MAVSAAHHDACIRNTGAAGTLGLRQDLRWPGYVGSLYERSSPRILCVAQIHHATELLRTLGHLQDAMRAFCLAAPALTRDPASQARKTDFLTTLTSAYESAIIQWGPWTKFRKVLRVIGLDDPRKIAYTNVAKCWQTLPGTPEVRPPQVSKPMKCCYAEYPLERLARAIEADAILLLSATSTIAYVGITDITLPVYAFPGRPSDKELAHIGMGLAHDFGLPAMNALET